MTRRWRWCVLGLAVAACGPEDMGAGVPHAGARLYETTEQGLTVCPGGSLQDGVDVSSYQGTIDWKAAAASGIKWAYAKATEGTGYPDPTFPGNWSGMAAAGVVRGAYHFFHPGMNGTQQADYFLAYVGPLGSSLPPMLDWEVTDNVSGSTASANAQAFIDEVRAKTGRPTMIYTSPGLWSGFGASNFGANPLWVADWTYATSSCPIMPSGWSNWVFWQWSDGKYGTGSVPGIPATVDRDVFNGTLAQLQAYGNASGSLPSAQQSGNDAMTIVNWPDQHFDLFAMSPSGAEQHVWTTGTGDSFGPPATIDTGAACGSAAAFWGAPWTYAELWSPLSDGSTGHAWYTSGVGWNKYQSLGGSNLTHFATLVWLDGRSEVFALGGDGAIWHDFWDLSKSAWSGWQSLGGSFATGPGTVTWSNGTGELFAVDAAGKLWHSWSGSGASFPNGWYAWTQMGSGMASRPSPVRWADGHAEVFVRGQDGQLYHSDFSLQSGWPALSAIGGGGQIVGEPSAIMNGSGKGAAPGPEVFARDPQGRVVHLWWTGSGYSNLAPLGSQVAASDPLGWIRGDGTAEVFAIDPSGNLVHTHHDPTNGWSAWASIASGFDPCTPELPPPPDDAGTPADAGTVTDAGTGHDAGVGRDAGAGFDAGGSDGGGALTLGGGGGQTTDADAGSEPLPIQSKSCCATGTGPDGLALVLCALAALARRRRTA